MSNLFDAMAGWELDARSRLAPSSAANRTWLIRRLVHAAQKHHGASVMPRQLCTGCVSQFLVDVTARGGTGSYNSAVGAVKDFVNFLRRSGEISVNQCGRLLEGRKTRKFTRRPKIFIGAEQFPSMLATATPWDRGVLAFTLYTLARQSEVSAVRLRDLDLEGQSVMLYRLKRRRNTAVPVTPTMSTELERYLNWYAMQMHTTPGRMMDEHPDWFLFPRMQITRASGPDGRYDGKQFRWHPLPEVQAHRMERVMKRALDTLIPESEGRDPGKYPWQQFMGEGMHTIRRSGARAMFRHLSESLGSDRAIFQVSLMLDHENTTVTALYIGMDQEREELHAWLRQNDPYASPAAPPRRLGVAR